MEPYHVLFALLAAAAVLGLGLLLAGSSALAATVTRPISLLEDAAHRLQRGKQAQVIAQSKDEIERFAMTFNTMDDEIRRRETELKISRDQAEAANRAKSSFLANPDQRQMVGIIENFAAVLRRVLDDVLDLARVEAGRLQIVAEDFHLGEAVRASASGIEVLCHAKGLHFKLDLDTAERSVAGDRVRLQQILGNLLSNAVKFTEQGTISLSVWRTEAGVYRFEVRETGIGFDAALSKTLFQPFQQADDSITRRFGGTGLGLSITRELAQAMGGELTASSAPGQGATFILIVPLAAAVQTTVGMLEASPGAAAIAPLRPAEHGAAAGAVVSPTKRWSTKQPFECCWPTITKPTARLYN
jgi:signal transduction histidine kinase